MAGVYLIAKASLMLPISLLVLVLVSVAIVLHSHILVDFQRVFQRVTRYKGSTVQNLVLLMSVSLHHVGFCYWGLIPNIKWLWWCYDISSTCKCDINCHLWMLYVLQLSRVTDVAFQQPSILICCLFVTRVASSNPLDCPSPSTADEDLVNPACVTGSGCCCCC